MALFFANQLGDVDTLFGQIILEERQTIFLYSPCSSIYVLPLSFSFSLISNSSSTAIIYWSSASLFQHLNLLDFSLPPHYFNIFITNKNARSAPFVFVFFHL
ncbi:hypothetical protein HanIR_Chr10g0486301 [Helianthus annuus]|nr:hypothetical protein HanIR_Chr10g0486301 [Helianthus annuus]